MVPPAIPEVCGQPIQRTERRLPQRRNGRNPQGRRRVGGRGRPLPCRAEPLLFRPIYRDETTEGAAAGIAETVPEGGGGGRLPLRALLLAGGFHQLDKRILAIQRLTYDRRTGTNPPPAKGTRGAAHRPDACEFAQLMNEASKAIREELNSLYQAGKIGINRTVNGKAVFVKEENQ